MVFVENLIVAQKRKLAAEHQAKVVFLLDFFHLLRDDYLQFSRIERLKLEREMKKKGISLTDDPDDEPLPVRSLFPLLWFFLNRSTG